MEYTRQNEKNKEGNNQIKETQDPAIYKET